MTDLEARTQRLLAYVVVAGTVGWAGTALVDAASPLSIAADIYLVVGLWAVLVAIGVALARPNPVIRRAKAWRIWGSVSLATLAVNAVANTPQLFPDPALFVIVQDYAYYHPWLAAYVLAYAATARAEPESRLMGETERRIYLGAALCSLVALLGILAFPVPDEAVLLVVALLTVLPAALALLVRRRAGAGAPATDGRQVRDGEAG
ncbi:hypothetical protein [Halosimplex sp. J119]